MEIITYLRVILRYWWVILLVTLAAGGITALFDSIRTPVYRTESRVAARPSDVLTDTRAIVDLVGQMGARYITGTFAQTVTSAQVRTDALRAVGMSEAAAAEYPLEANVLPDSAVIVISGSGPDPNTLANYLNATVTATISNTRDLYQVMDLVPLEMAPIPQRPSSPQPERDIPISLGLGLGLGILLALLLEYLRGSEAQRAAQGQAPKRD